jgi:glycosyltransferase involved in cell wall biosynthesis
MPDYLDYPSISVVIPSYNQGQYIEETLTSVLGQQYPKLEILVIDGGSTDNTVDILEKYSDKISYWHSKKDNGQADAINQGMKLSTGDILCWLNSDDMYLSGTLLDIGKRFRGLTDRCHLIYGAVIGIDQSEGKLYSSTQTSTPFDAFTLTYNDFIIQPASFWTRELWKHAGELDATYNYVLDWEWYIRASKFTEFEYVPRFYSVYRYHPLHKTSSGGDKRQQEILEVVKHNSSEYWIDLYSQIGKNYTKIEEKNKLLKSMGIPKKHLLLPLFFPQISRRLKNSQDLSIVMNMYGGH